MTRSHRISKGNLFDWIIVRILPVVLVLGVAAFYKHPDNPVYPAAQRAIAFMKSSVSGVNPLDL